MKKRFIFFLFILFALGQLFLTFSSIVTKETILKNGTVHKFQTKMVDPSDPFRGKYVALNLDNSINISNANKYEKGSEVFVLLTKDEQGFSHLSSISDSRPDNNNYLKLKIDSSFDEEISFEMVFDRYYIDENFAKKAEAAYWDESRAGNTYISVRVLSGTGILEELFISDVPVMEYLKAQQKIDK